MFDLQLDLKMYFIPPMDENGNAIRLTRKLNLPFPPYDDVRIYDASIDPYPMFEGTPLKNVVWDMSRSRFTADTYFIQHDTPLIDIPGELAAWIQLGWRLGSYLDDMVDDVPDPFAEHDDDLNAAELESTAVGTEPEIDEVIPTLPARKRPKEFNKLFNSLIRVVAEERSGTATVYAMWKTKRLFTEEQLKDNESKAAKQFRDAIAEFQLMTHAQRFEWSDKVCQYLPRIERVVAEAIKAKQC